MSKQIPQPRIRGQAFQNDDNSWSWEAVMTFGEMSVEDKDAMLFGPKDKTSFISKDAAIDNMRLVATEITDAIAKELGADPADVEYVDMSKGISKRLTKREFLRKGPFGKRYF